MVLTDLGVSTVAACALIGRPRATHYRKRRGPVLGPRRPRTVPDNGQALSAAEREAILTLINTGEYADLAIGQIWARELDEGRYWGSMSTMYRVARAAGQTRERRRQATHPAKVRPELMAAAPSQVWSWDITKLRGPDRVWFHLYVLIDIYSRFNPGWYLSTVEESNLAADFLADSIARNGKAPIAVHADRGTSMTSQPVSEFLEKLGVKRSHSRPKTSNDNPFSEAQFRTLKYMPEFPPIFHNIEHAKEFLGNFFYQYNYIHRHSGIGWHTPASVHHGTADTVDAARQLTLTKAYQANPLRFRTAPTPPARPEQVWINKPEPAPK